MHGANLRHKLEAQQARHEQQTGATLATGAVALAPGLAPLAPAAVELVAPAAIAAVLLAPAAIVGVHLAEAGHTDSLNAQKLVLRASV